MHIQTEQGCKSLGELCYFSKDRVSATFANAYNYVSVDNLLPDKKGKTLASSVPDRGYLFQYQIGDILLGNIRPYLKKIWFADITGATNGDVLVVRTRMGNPISPRFVYYVLSSDDFFAYNMQNTKGTKMPRGDKEAIMNYEFHVPSLKEQERIASALSAVDELLASLDKQIAKTRDIKQGVMQQLFSGATRIKGFEGQRQSRKLGEIGSTYSGLTGKSKQDFIKGNCLYITFLNVLDNPILKPELFETVYVGKGERQNNARRGDLFFNTSSETPEEVGICAVLNEDVASLYLNSFCFGYRLSDRNVDPLFLSYYFRSKRGRDVMSAVAQGITRYNLSKSAFSKIEITLPSLAEQKHIADVLTSLGDTIEDLEAKRQKYESIKAGMMQLLLTGTTTCSVNP